MLLVVKVIIWYVLMINLINFISSMIEENKYCSNVMKKHFKKELLMTNKDKEDFENFTKC